MAPGFKLLPLAETHTAWCLSASLKTHRNRAKYVNECALAGHHAIGSDVMDEVSDDPKSSLSREHHGGIGAVGLVVIVGVAQTIAGFTWAGIWSGIRSPDIDC